MVSIDFEIVRDGNVFKDAIVLPDDHGLTDEQIDAMKEARYAAWIEVINTPVEEQTEEVTE